MRVLVVPSTYDYLNLGEVAMLQVAVRRLRRLFSGDSIEVLTSVPALLSLYCPGASPVPYEGWFADHYLLGRFHRALPRAVSSGLVDLKRWIHRVMPGVEAAAIQWKLRIKKRNVSAFDAYRRAFEHADALAVSGLGGISDVFPASSAMCLDMVDSGLQLGIPVAIFGHGFGPLHEPKLLERIRWLLPRVTLIALREGLHGPAILRCAGVSPEKVVVTGDDAIELAYECRQEGLGRGIGVNLRLGARAGVTETDLDQIRSIVQAAARRLAAPLIPVPIARQGQLDAAAIRRLMEGVGGANDGGWDLDSPAKLIERMGACRVVVAGAYHAAVFALAQGIPTICLVKSEYYTQKCDGLADLFGLGCEVVSLSSPDWQERLGAIIEGAYGSAEKTRDQLLRKAEWQIQTGEVAYWRFQQMVLRAGAAA